MKKEIILTGFTDIKEQEAICVIGGIDKEVQKVLYYIGYAVGVIVKLISNIFK